MQEVANEIFSWNKKQNKKENNERIVLKQKEMEDIRSKSKIAPIFSLELS